MMYTCITTCTCILATDRPKELKLIALAMFYNHVITYKYQADFPGVRILMRTLYKKKSHRWSIPAKYAYYLSNQKL